jgi:hypothetical protein
MQKKPKRQREISLTLRIGRLTSSAPLGSAVDNLRESRIRLVYAVHPGIGSAQVLTFGDGHQLFGGLEAGAAKEIAARPEQEFVFLMPGAATNVGVRQATESSYGLLGSGIRVKGPFHLLKNGLSWLGALIAAAIACRRCNSDVLVSRDYPRRLIRTPLGSRKAHSQKQAKRGHCPHFFHLTPLLKGEFLSVHWSYRPVMELIDRRIDRLTRF